MKNEVHVMIDLETLGTRVTAPVVAIGAAVFYPHHGLCRAPEMFYTRVEWNSALLGRTADGSTLQWWLRLPDRARLEILKPGVQTRAALNSFSEFLLALSSASGKPRRLHVWGNGASFDIAILEDLYQQYGLPVPWRYFDVLDCRTVEFMAEGLVDKRSIKRTGDHHNALDDALHQANYVTAMYEALRPGGLEPPGLSPPEGEVDFG